MKKISNIRQDYRGWKFWDKVPLIPRDQQWKAYFEGKFGAIDVDVDIDTDEIKETIQNTINNSLEGKLCQVHKHIEEAKEHLCCDICHAKCDVKQHIDNKFDAINFEEQFSNLNEQVETIIQKLDE